MLVGQMGNVINNEKQALTKSYREFQMSRETFYGWKIDQEIDSEDEVEVEKLSKSRSGLLKMNRHIRNIGRVIKTKLI